MRTIWRCTGVLLLLCTCYWFFRETAAADRTDEIQPFKAFITCSDQQSAHTCIRRYSQEILKLLQKQFSPLAAQIAQFCILQVQEQALMEMAVVLGVQNCLSMAQLAHTSKTNTNKFHKMVFVAVFQLVSYAVITFVHKRWVAVQSAQTSNIWASEVFPRASEQVFDKLSPNSLYGEDTLAFESELESIWSSVAESQDQVVEISKKEVEQHFSEELLQSADATKVNTPRSLEDMAKPIKTNPPDGNAFNSIKKSSFRETVCAEKASPAAPAIKPKMSFNVSTEEGRAEMRRYLEQKMKATAAT